MASPDTDELATTPLPVGEPEKPHQGVSSAADAETAPQERVGPERIAPETTTAETTVPQAAARDASAPEVTAPDASVPAASVRARQGGRWWRGFTGSLAAGLAVLAAGVLVVAGICLYTGAPGPGATLLVGHPVAAVLAVLAQRVADRRNGPAAVGAGVAVVLFTVSALTLFWLT
ncbi:hypothetical protein AB0F15_17405 [Amycolatopsis sp. NPDC026612]|uniref:hypothetical protein n=1 Tax=Amycolatopsis sp. NPDC026612 TaxID=3155466 RepID=UPI0033FBCFA0